MEFKEKKLEELKKIAKKYKLVGYSKLKKSDLIKLIKKSLHKSKSSKKIIKNKKVVKKSKSKKIVGGYIYGFDETNPNLYIPIEPRQEVILPENTFTIYTTGIGCAKLRYIWSFILAPKLRAIIPERRPIRIIHSELSDLDSIPINETNRISIHDFQRLSTYLIAMDNYIFNRRLINSSVTHHTLNFRAIHESGIENHIILDFAHLFKYSINTHDLVYSRFNDSENDNPNTFSGNSGYRRNVYNNMINIHEINQLIENIHIEQEDSVVTIREHNEEILNKWNTNEDFIRHWRNKIIDFTNFNEAIRTVRTMPLRYENLNVITFGFVGEERDNYDILHCPDILRYDTRENRIKTYIYDAVTRNKIFNTNDPVNIFYDRNINIHILQHYYGYRIINNLLYTTMINTIFRNINHQTIIENIISFYERNIGELNQGRRGEGRRERGLNDNRLNNNRLNDNRR